MNTRAADRCWSFALLAFCMAMSAAPVSAFSPYENYLLSGKPTHVGLVAQATPGKEDRLTSALLELADAGEAPGLAKAGISNLSAYSKEIHGARWFVVYFTYKGGKEYLGAAEAFESATEKTAALGELVVAHPRAERYGRKWLQGEWINFIRGKDVARAATSKLMIVTRVIPEKEMEYRTLHQTVWPGVVDQIVRGNIRDLNVFLVEMGDDLVEFLYLEYVGDDQAADDAMNQADPINIRWWKNTDACQIGLSGEGNWVLMDNVTEP
jgi:L-rhamnose mutarotase